MRHQALRELPRRATILMLLVTLVFGASCSGRHRTADSQSPSAGSLAESAPVSINQPVNYCVNRPIEPRRSNVQMLVDSSGSMIGFQKAVPQFVNWAQHSF